MSHRLKDDDSEGLKPDEFNGDAAASAKTKTSLKANSQRLKRAESGASKCFKGKWMLSP